jgi:CheY-like chemotaxis protein
MFEVSMLLITGLTSFIVGVPIMLIAAAPFVVLMLSILFGLGYGSIKVINWIRPATKLRVLVTDDDMATIGPLLLALKHLNIEVTVSKSGERTLELIQQKSYDLLVMDYLMPRLNGMETLMLAELSPGRKRKTPVVFYTGAVQENQISDQSRLSRFSVKGIWSKRMGYQELLGQLNQLFMNMNAVH